MEIDEYVKGKAGVVLSRSQANPILTSKQYDVPRHPLFWRHYTNPVLTHQWFNQKVDTAKFEKSHFGITTQTEEIRVYDDNVRLSHIYRRPLEQLQLSTIGYLEEWAGVSRDFFDPDPSWNMLKYINGHFAWHKDKVRVKKGFQHLGTQIILPPLGYSRFQEGELKIMESDGRLLSFRPEEGVWFYIIIPLGYLHVVQRVIGTRFSFTKEVFIKEEVALPSTHTINNQIHSQEQETH